MPRGFRGGERRTIALERLIARDGDQCWYCGGQFVPRKRSRTIDHVVPLALGGRNRLDNLRLACAQCNHAKGPDGPRLRGLALPRPAAAADRSGTAPDPRSLASEGRLSPSADRMVRPGSLGMSELPRVKPHWHEEPFGRAVPTAQPLAGLAGRSLGSHQREVTRSLATHATSGHGTPGRCRRPVRCERPGYRHKRQGLPAIPDRVYPCWSNGSSRPMVMISSPGRAEPQGDCLDQACEVRHCEHLDRWDRRLRDLDRDPPDLRRWSITA